MTQVIEFGLLGLGTGAVYALLATGVILVYKGSGVLNFGHGAMAMIGAFVFYELHGLSGWAFGPALVVTALGTALIGVLTYGLFIRRLAAASTLAKVILTLALLLTLQGAGQLIWGQESESIASSLPTSLLRVGSLDIPVDQLILLGIAVVVTMSLWAAFRYTRIGLATTALAENRRGAAALGWSPHRLAVLNWALAGALAGVAGALIAPLTGLQVSTLSLLVIPALAAALIGGFTSLPLALLGAVLLGIAQSEVSVYVSIQGFSDALPFFVIIVFLALRGKTLPGRGEIRERLPALGSGKVSVIPAIAATAVVLWLLLVVFNATEQTAMTTSIVFSIIMLSVVVLTGYAGQLSLAPFAFGGIAAFITGQLFAAEGWPFWLAALAGLAGAIPAGIIIGLPALRTRGVQLAVVTLGISTAAYEVIFTNDILGASPNGTQVAGLTISGKRLPGPSLLGLNVTATEHPARYAVLCFGALVVAMLAVANVRRGRAGRRMIAVRENERAATALGISTVESKLYAFVLAAVIASLGGILYAFASDVILYSNFDPFTGILLVAYTIIGGVGFILGPLYGGVGLILGGIGVYYVQELTSGIEGYIPLIGGVLLMFLITIHPDGIFTLHAKAFRALTGWVRRWVLHRAARTPRVEPPPELAATRVRPAVLEVSNLTVRFGGVVAVDSMSLSVSPGEVVGLIGPNGAGKTTIVDAVSGFVKPAAGTVSLDGKPIEKLPAYARARLGLSRSFQSLELFEYLTVRDNLRTASDERDKHAYVTNLIASRNRPLPAAAVAAVHEFALGGELDQLPGEIPYGRRRLVAVARAVAPEPSVLLLDEPAAGLDDVESAELAECVRRLADAWGIGILVIEHDMSFVMGLCDRVVVMDFGRKIADGPPEEIRNDPAVISAYLGEPHADTPATANGTAVLAAAQPAPTSGAAE